MNTVDRRAWLATTGRTMLGAAFWPGLAGVAAAAPAATASAPKPLPAVPALALRERKLANGLQVVSLPDKASATVSIQVWYRVGGKDDPAGRSGFAHLFEHLMFKSTRYMPSETLDRLTEDVGGNNNAFTAEDMTVYHEDVPSNHLERLLWAEAERMANLDVNEANFKSERAVVQEEFRQSVLANPYGRFYEAFVQQGFDVHPYKRSVIGSIEDLDAATLDDVRAFHTTFYRPDNAVLIVAGDFDPAQLDAWVDRYFGVLAKPAAAIPRVAVREPPRASDRRVALHGPQVPLPAVGLVWQGPPAGSDDAPALRVAARLLAAGESSRLNEVLVYRSQAAQSVGFDASLFGDAGLIVAYAVAAGRQPLRSLEQALLREIERLAKGPIGDAELDKVRTGLVTAAIVERQTPQGKAMAVGQAILFHNDAGFADRDLAQLQAVSAGDVQRVLQRYVLQAKRVTIDYTQGDAK